MCNSSLQISNSTSMFNNILIWNCYHQGAVGVVLKLITALLFFVGTPIHCWSLWVFFQKNNKPNLVFPLNITVLEIIYCFLCFINIAATISFSGMSFKLLSFVIGISWTVRPLLQICMCIEHYLAVIHPVTFLRYKDIQYRIVFSGVAWLIGVGNSLRLVFVETYYFPDHVFFLFFCIALTVSSFCCASVLHALKRPGPGYRNNVETTEKDRASKTDKGRAVENQQKRRAFRIISHILVSILVCYLPLVIANFMRLALSDDGLHLCKVFPLILFITLFTLLISPLIRICNDGHLKHSVCFSKLRGLIKGTSNTSEINKWVDASSVAHSFWFLSVTSVQLCSSMCNSSFIIWNATIYEWFCICEGHFGPYFIFCSSVLCFTVTTPIHCWFLWVLLHGEFKPNSVFPLNTSVLDLIYCIQCISDIFVVKFPSMLGQNMLHFVIGLGWTFRPLLQICICVEQYLAVIHPVTFLKYKGIKYRIALVTVAWLIALANSLRLVYIGIYYFQDHIFFVVFCIAVSVTSFCCASVLHALKRPGPGDRNNVETTEKDRANKTDRGRAVENQQKRRAFRIISHILVSILVCYLPQVVTYFLRIAKVNTLSCTCEAIPLILSITTVTLLITPLVRMYNEGHLKCILCFLNVFQ